MKPRKLLLPHVLTALREKTEMGVPLARAMRQLDVDMTLPTASRLLEYCNIDSSEMIAASLAPEWLDPEGPAVQEQPSTHAYHGYFPLGEWVCRT